VTNKFLLSADIQAAAQAGTITQVDADSLLLRLNAPDWNEDADKIPDELMDRIRQGVQQMLSLDAEADDPERWRFNRRDHIGP
jgi:hypothetical protein